MTLRRFSSSSAQTEEDRPSEIVYQLCYTWEEIAWTDDPSFFRPIIESSAFQEALDRLGRCTIQLIHASQGYSLCVRIKDATTTEHDIPEELFV